MCYCWQNYINRKVRNERNQQANKNLDILALNVHQAYMKTRVHCEAFVACPKELEICWNCGDDCLTGSRNEHNCTHFNC